MKKIFSFVSAFLLFFLLFAPSPARASNTCSTISISPSSVKKGSSATVIFSNPLQQSGEGATLSIAGLPQQTVDCSDGSSCQGGITNAFTINTSDAAFVAGQTYTATIRYISAAGGSGNIECSKPLAVTAATTNTCSPISLQSVSPNPGSASDTFNFTGCIGAFGSGQNAAIVITDPTKSNQTVRSIQVTGSAASGSSPAGLFSVSAGGFTNGLYDVKLYASQTAQGGSVQLRVGETSTICHTAISCSVGTAIGTRTCTGVNNNNTCEYDKDSDCSSTCQYCGDNTCSSGESISSCPQDCKVGNNYQTITNSCNSGVQEKCAFLESIGFSVSDCNPNTLCQLIGDSDSICRTDGTCGKPTTPPFDYCAQVPDGAQRTACQSCIKDGGGSDKGGPKDTIYTAVGCIHTTGNGLASDLIKLLLGIAGGVALLSILAGAFIFATSQGEANKVKEAKELITAAVTGLLFIIFSVIILDFVGVKILAIPGLG